MRERADELREVFDRSFAAAPDSETAAAESLLTVSVGVQPYAIRLAEVSGLFVDRNVTSLPSPVSELLGVAGLRGRVLPVYDLGMLLGSPRAAAPRWMLVAAGALVGLAFDGFDGYVSVRPEAIVPAVQPRGCERHVREVVRAADCVRPLVSLASVLDWIGSQVSTKARKKERWG